jgi:hypothetical protein
MTEEYSGMNNIKYGGHIVDLDGKITLIWISKNSLCRGGLDSSGSRQVSVTGSCENTE